MMQLRQTRDPQIQKIVDEAVLQGRRDFKNSGPDMATRLDEKRAREYEFRAIEKALIETINHNKQHEGLFK